MSFMKLLSIVQLACIQNKNKCSPLNENEVNQALPLRGELNRWVITLLVCSAAFLKFLYSILF